MFLLGSGQVDLTPPEPLPLGGYTERRGASFVPGGEPLLARVRIIDELVLVTAEMLTMPESLVAKVKEKTGERNLFMVATHTHGAPDSQMLNDRMTLLIPGISSFRRRWLEWYSDKIAQAIREARRDQTASVAHFELRSGLVAGARGRRDGAAPSQRVWEWRTDTNSLVTLFGAHPTLVGASERKLNGDWPGEVMRRTQGLAWTGAIGDVSPVPMPVSDFARLISAAPAQRRFEITRDFRYARVTFVLDPPTPHPQFAVANGVTPQIAQSVVSQFAPKAAEVFGIRVGKLILVGIPGEPTAELEREAITLGAKNDLGVAFVSHVNGWIGYILSKSDYERGGYEAQLAMHGPKTGDRLKTAVKNLLEKLSYPKPGTEAQKRRPSAL